MDTRATVIVPQDQIPAAKATSEDASKMFDALFQDENSNIFGVASGAIYDSTLNALSAAQIPGLLFRFPEGQLEGLTPYPPAEEPVPVEEPLSETIDTQPD